MAEYTILIADDEFIECRVLKKKLEQLFPGTVTVLTASNGRETIAEYEKSHPQILILDIEMPGISGLEAAEQIRREDRACSIIFLTAFDEFDYARKAITVHALDYLLKPCDEKELQAVVQEAMRIADAHVAAAEAFGGKIQGAAAQEQQAAGSSAGRTSGQPGGVPMAAQPQAGEEPKDTEQDGKGTDDELRLFIEEHYSEPVSVQDAAAHFGYADAYFCRIFKQHFGISFVTYLTNFRIRKAKELLGHKEANVREIARAVGYEDSNYFAKVFRRTTGESPSEYRAGL